MDTVDAWDGAAPPSQTLPDRERVNRINWELKLIEMRQHIKKQRLALIDAHVKLLRDEKEFHAKLDEADALEAKMREWRGAP